MQLADKTCVIVGSNGMLGTDLVAALKKADARTIGLDVDEVDIRRADSVIAAFETLRPTLVLNAAAITDVDGCETDEEQAYLVNAAGAGNLARACRRMGAFLLHVSTDYVFDGLKGSPYYEDDTVRPLGVYGRSKALGERLIREALPESHCIVRTQWLFGLHGRNFIETIIDRAHKAASLKVVNDQFGSPTYTVDLAEALTALCAAQAKGAFHVTNTGITTWYSFARKIIAQAGMEGVLVEPLRTEQLTRPAPRPAYSALDNSKFIRLVGRPLRSWEDALADYMRLRSMR